MKKSIIILLIFGLNYSVNAQNNEFNTNGNVLIRNNALKLKNYFLLDSDGDFTGGNYFTIQDDPTNNFLRIGYKFDSNLVISSSGNVGIGTESPQRKLQISSKGASIADQPLKPEKWQVGIGNADGDDQGEVLIGTYGKQPAIQGHGTGTSYKLLLNPFDGNVGIGTYNPGAWKLAVNGKIRAKEIKVETGWSDFVFFDDYKLPRLEDVENHIKENGHLKDIPSAKEVKENGIFLGEMDAKLLQKIEELTLYTIQQQKELSTQQKQIEKLEKENTVLKSLSDRLLEIEKQLNVKK